MNIQKILIIAVLIFGFYLLVQFTASTPPELTPFFCYTLLLGIPACFIGMLARWHYHYPYRRWYRMVVVCLMNFCLVFVGLLFFLKITSSIGVIFESVGMCDLGATDYCYETRQTFSEHSWEIGSEVWHRSLLPPSLRDSCYSDNVEICEWTETYIQLRPNEIGWVLPTIGVRSLWAMLVTGVVAYFGTQPQKKKYMAL